MIGTILGFTLLLIAMCFDFATFQVKIGNLAYFIDIPSLLIVVGGTVASVLISWPMGDAKGLFGFVGSTWKPSPVQLVETLTLIVDVAKIARKNILAIEDALPSIENLFLRGGLRLVVDRVDRQDIVDMLAHQIKYDQAAKETSIGVVGSAASLCPAWGMLGTLVGLVLLLQNLDDPSMIGPAMAVALITTFYGSLFANVFFSPAKNKLEVNLAEEKVLLEMIRDGVLYIEAGQRPDFIESDLMNYLPPDKKAMYEALKFEGGGGDGGTARECLRYKEIEHLDMVEIDGRVVELSQKYLPSLGGQAWKDPRLHLHIKDGINWVANAADASYDVVIVDGSDPSGPSAGLFNQTFFKNCKRVLRAGGVFATQSESPEAFRTVHIETVRVIRQIFGFADPLYGWVPMYPSGWWSWTFASTDNPRYKNPIACRAETISNTSTIWSTRWQRGAFDAIPAFIERELRK